MITRLAVIAMALANNAYACEECGGDADPVNLWVDFDSPSSSSYSGFGKNDLPSHEELMGSTMQETEDKLAAFLNGAYGT